MWRSSSVVGFRQFFVNPKFSRVLLNCVTCTISENGTRTPENIWYIYYTLVSYYWEYFVFSDVLRNVLVFFWPRMYVCSDRLKIPACISSMITILKRCSSLSMSCSCLGRTKPPTSSRSVIPPPSLSHIHTARVHAKFSDGKVLEQKN